MKKSIEARLSKAEGKAATKPKTYWSSEADLIKELEGHGIDLELPPDYVPSTRKYEYDSHEGATEEDLDNYLRELGYDPEEMKPQRAKQ